VTSQSVPDTVPSSFGGTLPEYVVYITLVRLGKQPDVDFTYQSSQFGGRMERGGLVVDFLFYNPPDLAIGVQGVYYHYGFGTQTIARDRMAREQLAGQGVSLIFIDEDDVLTDPVFYVREALNYNDHSRLAKGT